jgi:hypothetical protein
MTHPNYLKQSPQFLLKQYSILIKKEFLTNKIIFWWKHKIMLITSHVTLSKNDVNDVWSIFLFDFCNLCSHCSSLHHKIDKWSQNNIQVMLSDHNEDQACNSQKKTGEHLLPWRFGLLITGNKRQFLEPTFEIFK